MVSLPTFRQLEHLVLLADHGHFGRAAETCHVTQSTLSASIKELEKVLQASLVDRTQRRVVLTPLGLEIVERARRILQEGKELAEAARADSEPLSGTLAPARDRWGNSQRNDPHGFTYCGGTAEPGNRSRLAARNWTPARVRAAGTVADATR